MVLEASAAGPDGVVAVAGSRAAAAVARQSGVPVWAVVGPGPAPARPLFDALLDRVAAEHGDEPWEASDEAVPAALVDASSDRPVRSRPRVALATADCPVAAELLRSVPRL